MLFAPFSFLPAPYPLLLAQIVVYFEELYTEVCLLQEAVFQNRFSKLDEALYMWLLWQQRQTGLLSQFG